MGKGAAPFPATMYKLNILPVEMFEKPISKNKMMFSHEYCDVCNTQGIKFEAVSYQDRFDYNAFRYHNYTYKAYIKMGADSRRWIGNFHNDVYLTYYVCSDKCATMLQLQLGD